MYPQHHKPSDATGLKEYQLSIMSAVMDWPMAQKWSLAVVSHDCEVNSTLQWTVGHPPVNQLTLHQTACPSKLPKQFGGTSNLLVYINFIQHLGNILCYTSGGHLCRLMNYICLVITLVNYTSSVHTIISPSQPNLLCIQRGDIFQLSQSHPQAFPWFLTSSEDIIN
jgi:hypothetical protein